MKSRTIDLGGPVHYADFGGSGPALVLVHGLGGSHLNWLPVGPRLAERGRVLAPDLVGFGRTSSAGRSAGLEANRAMLERFIDEVVGGPAILVGNSMGGTLSVLHAVQRPEQVSGLVLVAPAQPPPWQAWLDPAVGLLFTLYFIPGLGELFTRWYSARLGGEGLVRQMLDVCCPDVSRIPEDIVQLHIDLANEQMARTPWIAGFLEAARTMLKVLLRRRRYRELEQRISAPTLLIHGTHDRLVRFAVSRQLAARRPDWTFEPFEGAGHAPMMEAPDKFAQALERWLDGAGRTAAELAPRLAAAS